MFWRWCGSLGEEVSYRTQRQRRQDGSSMTQLHTSHGRRGERCATTIYLVALLQSSRHPLHNDPELEEKISLRLFPGLGIRPKVSSVADRIAKYKEADDTFKELGFK